MADRELDLIAEIPPEALAHFDDLEGIEHNLPAPDAAPSFAMRTLLAAPMTTFFTAQVLLVALNKWKLAPKFYRSDWATHNRNAAQGWGPYNGHVVHCFGSDLSDDSSNAYINRGDLARGMPGPLAPFTITDDGQLWVIGWGAANHTGYMEKGLHSLVLRDAAYLDRDYRPTTSGSTPSAGIGPVNPHYSAVEMTYGKAPTAAQLTTNALLSAALMDAAGADYTGGSVVGHREATAQRGDPTAVPMWRHRLEVNRLLKLGPPSPIVVAPAPPAPAPVPPKPAPPEEPDMQFSDVIPGTNPPITVGQALVRGAYAYGQVISTGSVAKSLRAQAEQVNKQAAALGAIAEDVDNIPETVKQVLEEAAVKVDVNVTYPQAPETPTV